jgi:phosphatidate phosphatase APP1
MTTDQNKGITAMTYNYMNLPQQVTKGTNEKIVYTYDATGRKLKQEVFNASNVVTKTTDYVGEYIYENDILQFVNHEEGRITKDNTSGIFSVYQYHLKDHLGNVRVTFTTKDETEVNTATLETAWTVPR